MRTWVLLLIGAAATVLSLGALLAQPADTGGGPASRPTSQPGMHHGHGNGPGGGFHLLPPFVVDKLNLTDDQRKQLEELAKETKAKLDKILTPEQQKILQDARPPRPGQGGPGGQGKHGGGPGGRGGGPGGQGGPGGGPSGDDAGGKDGPPPSE